jgi:predicted transcriptional regulator
MGTNEKNWGHLRLKPELWEKVKEIATKERRTLNAVASLALEQYVARKEKGTGGEE